MDLITIEKIIFAYKQGEGFILGPHSDSELNALLDLSPVELGSEILIPGNPTTLDNYFCRNLIYRGQLEPGELIFFNATVKDLFEEKHYFQIIHKITETRFFEMFSYQSGRDFNFKNGKWK